MKIEIVFDNGEKAIVYGMSPLDFSFAITNEHILEEIDFQDKESIEDAIRKYNGQRILA